jgi:hypothetical protein
MRPGEVIEDPPWRSSFAPIGVQRAFAALRDAGARRRIGSLGDPDRQAAELLIESITYPTRFDVPEAGRLLYDDGAPRTPRLDLPFSADDVRGTVILER